jgi:hypothetical protein
MKKKIHITVFGACGDDCSSCPRYLATTGKNKQDLERVKELWVLFGWRKPDVSAEALKCKGCGPENECAYRELRDCAFGKGLENCGICKAYPCRLTNAAFEKTENLFHSCKSLCTEDEMNALTKAFRRKKSNLDRIHALYAGKS